MGEWRADGLEPQREASELGKGEGGARVEYPKSFIRKESQPVLCGLGWTCTRQDLRAHGTQLPSPGHKRKLRLAESRICPEPRAQSWDWTPGSCIPASCLLGCPVPGPEWEPHGGDCSPGASAPALGPLPSLHLGLTHDQTQLTLPLGDPPTPPGGCWVGGRWPRASWRKDGKAAGGEGLRGHPPQPGLGCLSLTLGPLSGAGRVGTHPYTSTRRQKPEAFRGPPHLCLGPLTSEAGQ